MEHQSAVVVSDAKVDVVVVVVVVVDVVDVVGMVVVDVVVDVVVVVVDSVSVALAISVSVVTVVVAVTPRQLHTDESLEGASRVSFFLARSGHCADGKPDGIPRRFSVMVTI